MTERFDPPGMSKWELRMWHSTDFMLNRYVRFSMLGLSLCAAVFVAMWGFYAVIDHDWWQFAIDFALMIMNGFILGWNFRRYQRDYWNG